VSVLVVVLVHCDKESVGFGFGERTVLFRVPTHKIVCQFVAGRKENKTVMVMSKATLAAKQQPSVHQYMYCVTYQMITNQ
jgi:hypothetical protein